MGGITLTLQHALLLLGAALVLAVYLLSRRQYPRARGKAARERGALRPSPPFINELESDYDEDADDDAEEEAEAERPAPPQEETMPREFAGGGEPPADEFCARMIEGFERVSQVDYWVKIIGRRDVGREIALGIFHENAADFSMPRSIHGVKMPDNAWRNLEEEAEGSRFGDLVITIQLADRSGAVTPREMAKFSELVSRMSEVTGREFSFMAPVENAIAQARVIADFIAHFDSEFALRIRPRSDATFAGADLHRCALELGLEAEAHHYARFQTAGGKRAALYTLMDFERRDGFDFENIAQCSARELVFLTRPALNHAPGAVFAEMVNTARAFAARMDGAVCMRDEEELPQATVDAQRAVIEQAAAEMARFGIPAGSAEAVKIF
ncbi:MAG: cell division protein ZipA C-terminal FtsZ-binding domain-containing protein [Gammaproteobacteria bacterium]